MRNKIYAATNIEKVKAGRADWYQRNRSSRKVKRAESQQRLKREVIDQYGSICSCCGESELVFLCIDHVNGGGNEHRREIGHGSLYWWLRRNGWPTGFRVLCHNCNFAEVNGGCPHKKIVRSLPPATLVTDMAGVEAVFA